MALVLEEESPALEAQRRTWRVLQGQAGPTAAGHWLIGGAIALAFALTAAFYVLTVNQEVANVRAQADLKRLKHDNTALRRDLEAIQNPRRIESEARKAAMRQPTETLYLTPAGLAVAHAPTRLRVLPTPPALVREGF